MRERKLQYTGNDPLSGKARIGENYKCLRMVNPLPDPSRRRDGLGRGGPTRERGQ